MQDHKIFFPLFVTNDDKTKAGFGVQMIKSTNDKFGTNDKKYSHDRTMYRTKLLPILVHLQNFKKLDKHFRSSHNLLSKETKNKNQCKNDVTYMVILGTLPARFHIT